MTSLVPPPQSLDDRPAKALFIPISVNLLPEEVVAARAGRSARTVAIAALLVVTAGVGAWDFHAGREKDAAAAQLAAAQQQVALSKSGATKYDGLTHTKSSVQALTTQLCSTTAGNLAWSRLITDIRAVMPAGMVLTGISGTASPPVAVAPTTNTEGSSSSPSASPSPTPTTTASTSSVPVNPSTGSIVLTGTERSKSGAPTLALRLVGVKGLLSPYVTSVATDARTKSITFGIQVTTDKRALSARYCKAGS